MTRSNSGNPTHETFHTTHVLISLDASYMAGDFELGNFLLTLPLSIVEEEALRQELAECRSFSDLAACLLRYEGLSDTEDSRPTPELSPEQNATADRLLRDALGDQTDDPEAEADTAG